MKKIIIALKDFALDRFNLSDDKPGVAIATALMPPLCTAGYGLATGQWYFFLGAAYLFFINSLFICLASFLIVKHLKFRKRNLVRPNLKREYPDITTDSLPAIKDK